MSLQQTATTSFKVQLAQGVHNFGPTAPDTFKIALYIGSATLDATTAVYTTTGETSGTGYTAGGEVLMITVTPTSVPNSTVAYLSFADAAWSPAVFTARGALIYNSTKGNKSVAVLDFGADKTAATTFTVVFPAADQSSAILRIS